MLEQIRKILITNYMDKMTKNYHLYKIEKQIYKIILKMCLNLVTILRINL